MIDVEKISIHFLLVFILEFFFLPAGWLVIMTEEDQGPPPLCFINAKGPTAIESPARPGQMDQVAHADVLLGSKDEVHTTHHGDKSNDLIWETLKTIQMQIAGMQCDFFTFYLKT